MKWESPAPTSYQRISALYNALGYVHKGLYLCIATTKNKQL